MHYCETFEEVENYWGKDLRYYARRVALDTLSFFSKSERQKRLQEPRIHFLYFHHIFSDEKTKFDRLVAELSETHTFISHSEAVERLLTNRIDKPYISWSSDDGFKNNLDAASILNKYSSSCCFFVNPFSIGLNDYNEIQKFCDEKLIMPPIEFMNWQDLKDLLDDGHEIGAHTLEHDAVNKMELNTFKKDLIECKAVLEENCGTTIAHFAYPYGKFQNFSKEAYDAVFEAGYTSCSTAVRGCHKTFGKSFAANELFIRRDQVIAAWNKEHINYFMSNSVKDCEFEDNLLPASYIL